MLIRRYNPDLDYDKLMALIEAQGEDWKCYSDLSARERYGVALEGAVTYVAYEEDKLCGYSRSLNDFGFYIYVCDLLVAKEYRGHEIGKQLIECLVDEYPNQTVYVMSDVDDYYKKLGYKLAGSVFELKS